MSEKIKVLIVASEVNPYVKSGGLGDVIGSLPKELKNKNIDVRVCVPKYKTIRNDLIKDIKHEVDADIWLSHFNKVGCSIFSLDYPVKTYFIENHDLFSRDNIYGYNDDYFRFAFFTKASIEMLPLVDFKPDIIMFNDWQSALGPLYLKDFYSRYDFYSNIKTIFTIHNLQYQGNFGRNILYSIGLNDGYYNTNKLECYKDVNFMKGGILYADKVTTVSETYAMEIQRPEYGYGLDGILREINYKVCGILNGIDTVLNDPKTDNYLVKNFDKDSAYLKAENKIKLQEELNLPVRADVPMVAIISRLVNQKGLDLIASAMQSMMEYDIQLVVLGTGDKQYEDMFKYFQYAYNGKVSANIFFSEDLAHKIYASADFFLMPSLFEPCGLGQMFAMRYGTVPIVRNVGGLCDTVSMYNYDTKEGNGFKFNDYDVNGLLWCFNEAINSFYKEDFSNIRTNAMTGDYSFAKSAEKYVSLFNELCK